MFLQFSKAIMMIVCHYHVRNHQPGIAAYLADLAIKSGWWLTYPSEKYEFVSWDDDIPNIYGKIKVMFQTTNQLYPYKNGTFVGYI